MHLRLFNTAEDRRRLLPALEEFVRRHSLPASVFQAADLALEEHITNIFAYAYDDDARHEIDIRLTLETDGLHIAVEDDGRPYDPLTLPAVDTSVHPDEKPIGGLGVHLIRSFMDEVAYRREGDRNILRMRKTVR